MIGNIFGSIFGSGTSDVKRSSLIAKGSTITDVIGVNTRTLYNLQYIHRDAASVVMSHADIVVGMTVTKPAAATAPTVGVGTLTLASGDLWSFAIMTAGAVVWGTYEFATPISATTAIVFDTSGNGRHLTITVADTSTVCLSRRITGGSDWLNLKGFLTSINSIKQSGNMTVSPWAAQNGASVNTAGTITFAATANSRMFVDGYQAVSGATGDMFLFACRLKNATGTMAVSTVELKITETNPPWSNTKAYHKCVDNIAWVTHTLTRPDFLQGYFTNYNSYPGTVDVSDIVFRRISEPVKTLLSFGDSTCAFAYDSATPLYHKSYTNLFLINKMIPGYNLGVGGHSLSQIIADFDAGVVGKTIGTIICGGGVNDMWAGEAEPTFELMKIFIGKAMAISSHVNVVGISPIGAFLKAKVLEYNSLLSVYCTSLNLPFVDPHEVLADSNGDQIPGFYILDTTHYSSAGHKAVFELMSNRFRYAETPLFAPVTTTAEASRDLPIMDDTSSGTVWKTGTFKGRAKYNLKPISSTGDTTIIDTNTYQLADTDEMRTATGWIGTANTFFNADGTPKTLTGTTLKAAGIGPLVWVGETGKWLVFKDSANAKSGLGL